MGKGQAHHHHHQKEGLQERVQYPKTGMKTKTSEDTTTLLHHIMWVNLLRSGSSSLIITHHHSSSHITCHHSLSLIITLLPRPSFAGWGVPCPGGSGDGSSCSSSSGAPYATTAAGSSRQLVAVAASAAGDSRRGHLGKQHAAVGPRTGTQGACGTRPSHHALTFTQGGGTSGDADGGRYPVAGQHCRRSSSQGLESPQPPGRGRGPRAVWGWGFKGWVRRPGGGGGGERVKRGGMDQNL